MEFANQLLYLAAALLILGMIFGAYRGINKSFNFDESTFFWFYALLAQFLSFIGMFAYPYLGKAALVVGNGAQVAVGVLLGLLFRSFNEKLPKQYILTLAWMMVVVLVTFSSIEYKDHLILEFSLMGSLMLWQIYELLRSYRKHRSIYLFFLIGIIAIALLSVAANFAVTLDVSNPIQHAISHGTEYEDDAIETVLRMIGVVCSVLVFLGISNYFFEKLWKVAIDSLHAKEDQMLKALNELAIARDNETGKHILRTREYVRLLCFGLRESGAYIDELNDTYIESLYKVAPLHDIGKVAIPDEILLKQGVHTPEEFDVMKTHADLGRTILRTSFTQTDNELLEIAAEMAGQHHEHWAGTGYPDGLKGEEISLAARIMGLADVYDALTTHRVYKDAWSHEEAFAEIMNGKGVHFDPAVVDAFLIVHEEFRSIAKSLKDE